VAGELRRVLVGIGDEQLAMLIVREEKTPSVPDVGDGGIALLRLADDEIGHGIVAADRDLAVVRFGLGQDRRRSGAEGGSEQKAAIHHHRQMMAAGPDMFKGLGSTALPPAPTLPYGRSR
jgi:hypothetical protein